MTLLNWTLSFVITQTFHSMVCSPLKAYGTFWFYAGVCVVGVLFVLTTVRNHPRVPVLGRRLNEHRWCFV